MAGNANPSGQTVRRFRANREELDRIVRNFAQIALCTVMNALSDEDILQEIASLLARRKSRGEMIGELLREISVLLLVFVPLDAVFNPSALSLSAVAALIVLALAVGYAGMRIEESRH